MKAKKFKFKGELAFLNGAITATGVYVCDTVLIDLMPTSRTKKGLKYFTDAIIKLTFLIERRPDLNLHFHTDKRGFISYISIPVELVEEVRQ